MMVVKVFQGCLAQRGALESLAPLEKWVLRGFLDYPVCQDQRDWVAQREIQVNLGSLEPWGLLERQASEASRERWGLLDLLVNLETSENKGPQVQLESRVPGDREVTQAFPVSLGLLVCPE